MKQTAMTAEQARTFTRRSAHSAAAAELVLRETNGCDCEAYVTIFTFRRWRAQGRIVSKGQHGVRLTTWIERLDDDGNPNGRFPRTVTVFCRCQTEEANSRA